MADLRMLKVNTCIQMQRVHKWQTFKWSVLTGHHIMSAKLCQVWINFSYDNRLATEAIGESII